MEKNIKQILENTGKKQGEKNKKLKSKIQELEELIQNTLSEEKINQQKRINDEFMNSINEDITSFNRLIQNYEGKLAEMNKKIVYK